MIAVQNAANEYARQQNALIEKQLNEENSRRKQQALMNFLGVVSGIDSQPTTQRVPSKNCFLEHACGVGAFSTYYWLNCQLDMFGQYTDTPYQKTP